LWCSVTLTLALGAGCQGRQPTPAATPKGAAGAVVAAAPGTRGVPAVPPPKLVQTGSDYLAIASSIDDYHAWLLAHRPDAALARTIYAPGTRSYVEFTRNLEYLRAHQETLVSIGQHCSYVVSTVRHSLVTLRLREVIAEDRTLDRAGRVVHTVRYAQPNDYVIVLTRGADGRWRLADITQVDLDPAVGL